MGAPSGGGVVVAFAVVITRSTASTIESSGSRFVVGTPFGDVTSSSLLAQMFGETLDALVSFERPFTGGDETLVGDGGNRAVTLALRFASSGGPLHEGISWVYRNAPSACVWD